jgi:hypothetical protein
MPDVDYIFKAARKKGVYYAQRRSVLWPLSGRRSLTNEAVLEDSRKLLIWWRAKVVALRDAGWADLQTHGKVQFVRNCPPSFVVALSENACRPCHMAQVCPWCYARDEVGDLFDKLARFLPKTHYTHTKPLFFLEVASKRVMTATETGSKLTGQLREWKIRPQTLLRQIPTLGAYYRVALEPRIVSERLRWKFSYRLLAIVKPDFEIPSGLPTKARRVRTSTARSVKQLVPIVARICRYPVSLMRGEEKFVLRALNARRTLRCKQTLGCLRCSSRREL